MMSPTIEVPRVTWQVTLKTKISEWHVHMFASKEEAETFAKNHPEYEGYEGLGLVEVVTPIMRVERHWLPRTTHPQPKESK